MARSREDIQKEIEIHEQEIIKLRRELDDMNGDVEVVWEGDCDRRKHGKPYLVIITPGNNGKKYEYDFLYTVDEYYDKGRCIKSTFQGKLKIGTILRGRVNASWKNDYVYFYEVTESGLQTIEESEALRKLNILK